MNLSFFLNGNKDYSTYVAGNCAFTIEEFKTLLQELDADGDGQTSKRVFADAARSISGDSLQIGSRWVRPADSDGWDPVDENEIDALVDFSRKHQGYKINDRFDYILVVVKSVLTKIHVKMNTEIDGNNTNIVYIHRR
ncbi:hypothetical protein POTOM_047620 [Populus tomentosa]|uniref:EF-hand domain-containing protein n=1 Tax=Populus tomentosa TaxID=118781 RepID=A0A8X8CCF9_POPTO|nr:hypothetical protein POTOM_047620 [Populus tomentosa]